MLAILLLNSMSRNAKPRPIFKENKSKLLNKDSLSSIQADYCRTCLAREDLEPIFVDSDLDQKLINDLKLCTGLEISSKDGLSQKICSQCVNSINFILKFRRKSRKAEKYLTSLALNKKRKRNSIQDDDVRFTNIKKAKQETVDYGDEFNDFGDDFQNNFEDVADENPGVEENPASKRRKGNSIPTAKSYKCPTCHKEFKMKTTYQAHMRFHTNFCVCEQCGKRCRNNNQLQEHKRARHGLGKIHKCAYCEYSSATKEALIIHERRHTGERPYVCDHCGATFHRRSNLVQHIAIHLPDKNFQCDLCPKRLKSRKFLQIHKHNAHTGKRYGYLCSICEHRFEKPNKVRAHTRRVHGLPDDQQGAIVRVQLTS